MQMTLDTRKCPDTVALGALSLPVSDYRIKAEVPAVRRTFCDGSHSLTLLDALPCTFTCSGVLLRDDASRVIAALQNEMQLHTPFTFNFAGFHFADMQIVAAECSVSQKAHTAAFTVSLTGGYPN